MTIYCEQPTPKPTGTVVKESGPKVIKFNLDELDPDLNEITHDTVHAIYLPVELDTSYQITAVQMKGRGQQDLPMHYWFSDAPYGMALPRNWQNLNIISLISHPTIVFVSESTVKHHPYDPSLLVVPAGNYYINIHNRHGASSFYRVVVEII